MSYSSAEHSYQLACTAVGDGDRDGAALGWSSVSVRAVESHELSHYIVQVPDGGAAAVLEMRAL